MAEIVKKKEKPSILYARGVSKDAIAYFEMEAERLGYTYLGAYFNALAKALMEKEDAAGNTVRDASGQSTKGA